jgi:uncharacterized protein YfdQ (DUF2303 family)
MSLENTSLGVLIGQLISALQNQGPQILKRDGAAGPLAVVPDNMGVVDLEKYGIAPTAIRQSVELHNLEDFTSLVNRFKNDASIIFVSPNLKSLAGGGTLATAVIDYHGKDAPAWGNNTITLKARASLAYEKLMALDGKLLPQPDFAVAIEDVSAFASSIPRADILEIAQTLRLTSKGDFSNFNDEASGSVDFRYNLQVNASAGTSVERKLTVPAQVSFKVAVLDGLDPVDVPVKLLYRTPNSTNDKVQMGFKILDRAWIEDAALQQVASTISEGTKLEAFKGGFAEKK